MECDRCPARAVYRYERDGLTLLFCGHHGKKNARALRHDGWYTYRLAQLSKAATA